MKKSILAFAGVSLVFLTPHRVDAQVKDSYGNVFSMEDIAVPGPEISRGSGLENCSAGIFNLDFENWGPVGFLDPVLGQARRDAACRVFTDLSALLQPAANPYSGAITRPQAFVNVKMIPFLQSDSQVAGRGSAYHHFIATDDGNANPYDDLTTTTQRNGILDGEAWRTINGGIDSWLPITGAWYGPIAPANFTPPTPLFSYYHMYVQVNFMDFQWYTDPASPGALPPFTLDLYTITAHEAMHALGFISHIGETFPGSTTWHSQMEPDEHYFSRYDIQVTASGSIFPDEPLLVPQFGVGGQLQR